MVKKPANQNKAWTNTQESKLRKLAKGNTPTRLIAYKLERTPASIQAKAHELNMSLKPINKSPYNRHK